MRLSPLLALFVLFGHLAFGQVIQLRILGACSGAMEAVITGAQSNSSALSTCGMNDCTYSANSKVFDCTFSYDLKDGETISAMHIHWKNITAVNGQTFAAGKYIIPNVTPGTTNFVSTISVTPSLEFQQVLEADNFLSNGRFYLNVHTNWQPGGALAGFVTSDQIPLTLKSSCNVATEIEITGSTTNTSLAAFCGVSDCMYSFTTLLFNCNVSYNLQNPNEVVENVHIHWRAFEYDSISYASQKFTFLDPPRASQGTVEARGVAIPANMTAAILSDPSLLSKLFYVNIHSSWSPPSPMGAIAGEIGSGIVPFMSSTTTMNQMTTISTTTTGGNTPTSTLMSQTPTINPCPATCCTFGTIPQGFTDFTITIQYEFNQFDCAAFSATLANQMEITPAELVFVSCIAGSVVLRAGAPTAAASRLEAQVATGTSAIPISQYASGGTIVTAPGGIPIWLILLAAVALLLLIVVIVALCLRRRQNNQKYYGSKSKSSGDASRYSPLEEMPVRPNPMMAASASSGPAQNKDFVTTQLLTDVVDRGESILPAKRGDIAFVTPEDWASNGEWVFAKVGLNEGYVPRLYLVQK